VVRGRRSGRTLWLFAAVACSSLAIPACADSPMPLATSSTTSVASASSVSWTFSPAHELNRAFGLVEVPYRGDVQFTGHAVYWLEGAGSSDASGPRTVLGVGRYDVDTGEQGPDEWLTGLLAGRDVQEWAIAGDRVAWIACSEHRANGDGSAFVGSRVYTALRGGAPIELPSEAWAALDVDGAGTVAAWGLECDGPLVAWYGGRSQLSQDRNKVVVTEPSRLRAWDSVTGEVHLLSDCLMALGGRKAFTAASQGSASNPGSRFIRVWDLAGDHRSTLRLGRLAVTPAAADEHTLVWTVLPPHSTDKVEADVAGCDVATGGAFTMRRAGSQWYPAVSGDVMVWEDEVPIDPDAPWTRSSLRGVRLSGGTESELYRMPAGRKIAGGAFEDVTLVGDRLFWTSATGVYGGRVVVGGTGLRLEPLGD
jgi:hypothetical protein